MIKIAVKLKCGCWKVRFARSGLLFFTRKDTKEKEISTSNILRMLQFIGDSSASQKVQLRY
jgi:hypothetical protein